MVSLRLAKFPWYRSKHWAHGVWYKMLRLSRCCDFPWNAACHAVMWHCPNYRVLNRYASKIVVPWGHPFLQMFFPQKAVTQVFKTQTLQFVKIYIRGVTSGFCGVICFSTLCLAVGYEVFDTVPIAPTEDELAFLHLTNLTWAVKWDSIFKVGLLVWWWFSIFPSGIEPTERHQVLR